MWTTHDTNSWYNHVCFNPIHTVVDHSTLEWCWCVMTACYNFVTRPCYNLVTARCRVTISSQRRGGLLQFGYSNVDCYNSVTMCVRWGNCWHGVCVGVVAAVWAPDSVVELALMDRRWSWRQCRRIVDLVVEPRRRSDLVDGGRWCSVLDLVVCCGTGRRKRP